METQITEKPSLHTGNHRGKLYVPQVGLWGEACQGNLVGLKVGLNVAKMGDGVMVSGGRHIVVSF